MAHADARRDPSRAVDGRRRAPTAPWPASPVLVDVGGWPAADLELFGYLARSTPQGWGWIDPRPPARRLAAAWRVGSLRARLADDVSRIVRRTDEQLAAVPPLANLAPEQLVTMIDSLGQTLVELHTAEVLAASLTRGEPGSLAECRARRTSSRARIWPHRRARSFATTRWC